MRHNRPITKQPQMAQSNYSLWKDFLVTLTDQLIEFIFIFTR